MIGNRHTAGERYRFGIVVQYGVEVCTIARLSNAWKQL